MLDEEDLALLALAEDAELLEEGRLAAGGLHGMGWAKSNKPSNRRRVGLPKRHVSERAESLWLSQWRARYRASPPWRPRKLLRHVSDPT